MASEAALERRCCALAKARGVWAVKLWPTVRGLPDRILLAPGGRVAFVEFKALRGRVSPAQKQIHIRLNQSGFEVWIIRHGWEFIEALDRWMATGVK